MSEGHIPAKRPKISGQLSLFPEHAEDTSAERLLTLSELAAKIGVPLFAIRRAAKAGTFPVYRVGNGRARVRLSEVVAAVEATKTGGV